MFADTCTFFREKMAALPKTAKAYEHNFCHGDFNACARFMVSDVLGNECVPSDLSPNERHRAERIIAQV